MTLDLSKILAANATFHTIPSISPAFRTNLPTKMEDNDRSEKELSAVPDIDAQGCESDRTIDDAPRAEYRSLENVIPIPLPLNFEQYNRSMETFSCHH